MRWGLLPESAVAVGGAGDGNPAVPGVVGFVAVAVVIVVVVSKCPAHEQRAFYASPY